MSISEIRLRNFKELRDQFCKKEAMQGLPEKGSQKRFAELIGVAPPYASNVLHGSRPIGTGMARNLEVIFKCPTGWMDTDHLSGTVIMDKMAHEFGKQAMRLYQRWPEEMRALLMDFAMEKMMGENAGVEPTAVGEVDKPTPTRKKAVSRAG
jgi:hypothetical protein